MVSDNLKMYFKMAKKLKLSNMVGDNLEMYYLKSSMTSDSLKMCSKMATKIQIVQNGL